MPSVLIVDDDGESSAELSRLLAAPDRRIEIATSAAQAIERARAHAFDVVVADLVPGGALSGTDLLRALTAASPGVRIVLLSSEGALETTVEALHAGAFDYMGKPYDPEALRATVDRALSQGGEAAAMPTRAEIDTTLIGRSPAMLQLYKQIAQASVASAPVLILGESGTGKELVARALHEHGPRQGHAFIAVNCAAIPDALLEAELFGQVRGGTTVPGALEQASGGTVFLNEIGELSQAMQSRLLRLLQEREVRPVGGEAAVRVDTRVIACTNANIEAEIAARRFRQDLFFRLAVFLIRVPPLRDRRQDVPLLVEHFSRAAALRAGRAVSLSSGAVARLRQLDWPGNVRELENVVERLVASARSSVIEAADVAVDSTSSAPTGAHPFADMPTLDELERRYLVYALQRFQGNRTRTAAALGIDRRTLYRMSARLGVPITASDVQHADSAAS